MPKSGSVVKALERIASHGIKELWPQTQTIADEALPLAREQEALLREILGWLDSARINPKAWRPVDLEAIKGFQKRARKVLP